MKQTSLFNLGMRTKTDRRRTRK